MTEGLWKCLKVVHPWF